MLGGTRIMATRYEVNEWGSEPGTNDDCNTGADYATEAEARAAFESWTTRSTYVIVELIEVSEGSFRELARRELGDKAKAEREAEADKRAWRREMAMEAGMAFGCDGYNDAMGY